MIHFEPDNEKQNGIFHYITNKYSTTFPSILTVYADPYSEYCELYTSIREDSHTRFLTPLGGYPDLFVHINKFKIRITHFAIRYTNGYYYTKSWDLYDYTEGKNVLIGSTTIEECGTGKNCNSDFIKIVPTTNQPIVNSLYFNAGNRSDGRNIGEYKSIEVYGYLFFESLNTCLKDYMHLRNLLISGIINSF